MEVNKPSVMAEVSELFARYEEALITNDVETLDEMFWNSPHTIRYGASENLYGYDAIAAFRAGRSPANLMRQQLRPRITTFGDDFAVTNTMFTRANAAGKVGRQSQTWVRTPQGWRITAAHVSVIEDPAEQS
ncbi:MAG: oxalurate catabolism protein HpxZ [Pseudomonadota bacterium]